MSADLAGLAVEAVDESFSSAEGLDVLRTLGLVFPAAMVMKIIVVQFLV